MKIKLQNITHYYTNGNKQRDIYNDFSLDINEGEFILIYGPSGCGKSTLLNIIGGLLRPCEGKVIFDDISYYDISIKNQEEFRANNIGFVFQAYRLVEDLSIVDNVMISMHKLPLSRKQKTEKVRKILNTLGLSNCINNKIIDLSGGEQQRVAIARTIAQDSKLVICDEPTGNLDEDTGLGIINILRSMKEENKTVIMVTHDSNYMTFADRVINIK